MDEYSRSFKILNLVQSKNIPIVNEIQKNNTSADSPSKNKENEMNIDLESVITECIITQDVLENENQLSSVLEISNYAEEKYDTYEEICTTQSFYEIVNENEVEAMDKNINYEIMEEMNAEVINVPCQNSEVVNETIRELEGNENLEVIYEIIPETKTKELIDNKQNNIVQKESVGNTHHSNKFVKEGDILESAEESIVESEKDCTRTRNKRRLSNPAQWKYNTIKNRREKGLQYMGRKENEFKVEKGKRMLKLRCNCRKEGTRIQCFKISEEDRGKIFHKFWKRTWPEKKMYVLSNVLKCDIKRPRNRKKHESQRTASFQYFLHKRNEKVRVCKTMFCNTLGISIRTISDWLTKDIASPPKGDNEIENNSGNRERKDLRLIVEKQNLNQFFSSLPKLESHYCRKFTSKLYLEPQFKTKSELYSLYKDDWCIKNNVRPLSTASFSYKFEDLNLALFSPRKDECDVCVGYRTKNIEENIYKEHITKKEEARKEKDLDKNSSNKVFTVDMQSVLLCPKSNVSALYYRMKLIVHNI